MMPVIEADAKLSPTGVFRPPEEEPRPSTPRLELPLEMLFAGPLGPRLRYRRPLPVTVRKEEETYVVECAEIEQFGYGSDMSEALDDFGKTVSEMYFYLAEEKEGDRLSDSLLGQYAVLQKFLEPSSNEGSRIQ